jgi:hypothetical protein
MAIVNSNELLNLAGAALAIPVASPAKINGSKVQYIAAKVAIAAGDDDTSTFRVARLPSNSVLKEIKIGCTAITGGTDFNLGVARSPSTSGLGAVIDDNALADALTFATASTFGLDGLKDVSVDNFTKELWELAGLTADPDTTLDIVLTAITIGTAAGTVSFKIEFTN